MDMIHLYCTNYLLKYVTERKIEGKKRQGRRRKQLVDYYEEKIIYWKMKEEELSRAVLRTRFGRGFGPMQEMQLKL